MFPLPFPSLTLGVLLISLTLMTTASFGSAPGPGPQPLTSPPILQLPDPDTSGKKDETYRLQNATPTAPPRPGQKVAVVTGAASGIGRATAKLLAQKGFLTYATSLDTAGMQELAALGCRILPIDVTKEEQMTRGVSKILAEAGTIDVLVNNAGYGQNGVVEELPISAIRQQFEVNVFGLLRMTQLVLPTMRAHKKGRIINMGSVGGSFTTPGASAYHASKWALESFTDGLRGELRPFGIDVVLIKPGGVRTNFIATANKHYPAPMPESPYLEFRDKFNSMTNSMFDPKNKSYGILIPEQVAEVVVRAASVRHPKTRYKVGVLARVTPRLHQFMTDNGWDRFMLRQIGVPTKKPNVKW